MYIPKHFSIQELLPQAMYEDMVGRGILISTMFATIFDERLLRLLDHYRGIYGPIIVNDWLWGGRHQFRGYRPADCDVGSELSLHKFGRAVDFVPVRISAETVRVNTIHRYDKPEFAAVGGIEMGVSWVHVDLRPRNNVGEINLFFP